jgi:DNA polymerase (family X)
VAQPDNATLAERLEALASLLDLSGASFYSVRAYRRAAELIRSTPADVAGLVRTGRVRELAGIGGSIETKLRELVETGRLAELEELEATVRPELVGLARLVGLAPQRLVEIGKTLGVSNADELREAAASKRLRQVAGIGPATEAKILAALERPRLEPRRGLTLNRALELTETTAERLGGIVAGDVRRSCDLSHKLTVVVASDDPDGLIARFAELPEIVSIAERGRARALGVTTDGVPLELVVTPPHELGAALVRATGSDD